MTKSPLDDEALEAAYAQALYHEKAGRFDLAADFYHQALALDSQDHAGAAVRLAALGRGETPRCAPKAYVTTLFDQHADVFDLILVDKLGYDVPEQLSSLLDGMVGERYFEQMLDLGCGTGLAGLALLDRAGQKTGVDLAENMIALAYDRGIYDALFVGDVVQFLAEEEEGMRWDLIVATDVLPYMGELEAFFTLVARHLMSGGVFGFSSEILDNAQFGSSPYKVGPHQRFAHQTSYIEKCLDEVDLKIICCRDIVVRQEQGQDVRGQLFLAGENNVAKWR